MVSKSKVIGNTHTFNVKVTKVILYYTSYSTIAKSLSNIFFRNTIDNTIKYEQFSRFGDFFELMVKRKMRESQDGFL